MNRFFAPGGEFSGIERMFSARHFAPDGRGLGDDGFVWHPAPGEVWVTSTDASIEGVHFRADWVTRPQALRKAVLSNLSDINAMGGRTRFALFTLGATPAYDDATFAELGAALSDLEASCGFRVVGGDTTRSRAAEFFSFTVFGVVEGRDGREGHPLLRSGARPGHKVYVSGSLGGSAAGLDLFRHPHRLDRDSTRDAVEEMLRRAHVEPQPPLALGPALAALNGSGSAARALERSIAAIDISDGLSSELWHLARQSDCALTIDVEKLPVHSALAAFDPLRVREYLLNGGEEYQLIFTGDFSSDELSHLRTLTSITEIGTVTEGNGVFITENGVTTPLFAGGFVHEG